MYMPDYTAHSHPSAVRECETLYASYRGERTRLVGRTVQQAEWEISDRIHDGEFGHGTIDILAENGSCRGSVTSLQGTVFLGFPC